MKILINVYVRNNYYENLLKQFLDKTLNVRDFPHLMFTSYRTTTILATSVVTLSYLFIANNKP